MFAFGHLLYRIRHAHNSFRLPHAFRLITAKLKYRSWIVGEESIAKPSYIKNVWVEFPNNS